MLNELWLAQKSVDFLLDGDSDLRVCPECDHLHLEAEFNDGECPLTKKEG